VNFCIRVLIVSNSAQNRLPDRESHPAASLREDRGLALVELALAIVIFLVLLSGIFDFSIALREHSVMIDAARAAGRLATSRFPTPDPTATAPQDAPVGSEVSDWMAHLSELTQSTVNAYMHGSGYLPGNYQTTTSFATSTVSGGGTTPMPTIRVSVQRLTPRTVFFFFGTGFSSCTAASFKLKQPLGDFGTPPC